MLSRREKIIEKIEEINLLVNRFIDTDHTPYDKISLFSGVPGAALFLSEYAEFKPDKAEECNEKIVRIIEDAFDYIDKTPFLQTSYCSGIIGTIWLTEYMRKKKVIDIDDDYLSADLIEYLRTTSVEKTKQEDCDLLHGGFGFWALLLECENIPDKNNLLKQQLDLLNSIAINTSKGRNWKINKSYFGDPDKEGFTLNRETSVNLGLAHGICFIMSLLAKTSLNNYLEEEVRENIHLGARLIQSFKNHDSNRVSFYPSTVLNGDFSSSNRLAWCYGDFCVANAFWMAWKATGHDEYKKEALDILDFTSSADDSETFEAGLCHGSGGVALIFKHFYHETGNSRFLDASNKWIETTLRVAVHQDGFAGYKTYRTPEYGGWKTEYGFLEGISGIGLAFLSSLSSKPAAWERVLQIC